MIKAPQHRGRIQAQGGGTEKSVAWAQDSPPTKSDMLRFCDELEAKLTDSEKKDRTIPLQKLRRFIRTAANAGGVWAISRHWFKPGSEDVRIDLEVLDGKACIPDP